MKNETEKDPFDDLIRQKLEQRSFPMPEGSWGRAEQLIASRGSNRSRFLLFLLPALVVATVTTLWLSGTFSPTAPTLSNNTTAAPEQQNNAPADQAAGANAPAQNNSSAAANPNDANGTSSGNNGNSNTTATTNNSTSGQAFTNGTNTNNSNTTATSSSATATNTNTSTHNGTTSSAQNGTNRGNNNSSTGGNNRGHHSSHATGSSTVAGGNGSSSGTTHGNGTNNVNGGNGTSHTGDANTTASNDPKNNNGTSGNNNNSGNGNSTTASGNGSTTTVAAAIKDSPDKVAAAAAKDSIDKANAAATAAALALEQMTKTSEDHLDDSSSSGGSNTQGRKPPPVMGSWWFAQAGFTYIPGFTSSDKTGKSFNPVIGGGFAFPMGKDFSLSFGLQYTYINHVADSSRLFNSNTYSFGVEKAVTEIGLRRIHYAQLPINVQWHLGTKNILTAGITPTYLISSESQQRSYVQHGGSIRDEKVKSVFGYTAGLRSYDLLLTAGYQRNFGEHWGATARYHFGLTDIKDDAYYGVTKFERNSGFSLLLHYKF